MLGKRDCKVRKLVIAEEAMSNDYLKMDDRRCVIDLVFMAKTVKFDDVPMSKNSVLDIIDGIADHDLDKLETVMNADQELEVFFKG